MTIKDAITCAAAWAGLALALYAHKLGLEYVAANGGGLELILAPITIAATLYLARFTVIKTLAL